MSSAIETHSPDSIYLLKVSKETLERGMNTFKTTNRNTRTNLKLLQNSYGSKLEISKYSNFIKDTNIVKLSKYSKQ